MHFSEPLQEMVPRTVVRMTSLLCYCCLLKRMCIGCQGSPTPKEKSLDQGQSVSMEHDSAWVPLDTGDTQSRSTDVISCNTNTPKIQSAVIRPGTYPASADVPANVAASSSGPATEANVPTLGKVQTEPSQSLKLAFAPSSTQVDPAFEPVELPSVAGKL